MNSLLLLCAAALPLASAEATQPLCTIPFTVYANGVYMKVLVNGKGPLQFQLDSAAAVHVINWDRAVELGLSMDEDAVGRAIGGGDRSSRAAAVSNATLRIGECALPPARTAAVNLNGVIERKGVRLDGLIGADLLRRYIVEIDAGVGVMKVYDPATWKYTGTGERVPIRVDKAGQPHIRATVVTNGGEPVQGEFLIDSGAAEATLMLSSPFAAKHNTLAEVRRSGEKAVVDEMIGVGGTSRIWTTRVAEVRIGSHVFRRPVIDITEATGGTLARADLAGTMGGEFLHRFRLTYDCPHNALYLEPTSRLEAPFDRDMSGVRWLLSGDKLNQFRVRSVIDNSPAGRAGIQAKDVLRSVDGRPASSFNKATLQEYLRRAGRRTTLVFLRDGQELAVTFTLERLV